MSLLFAINQDLFDGSAHALYCFRHCWWLAKTAPQHTVELIYPSNASNHEALNHFGFVGLPNLKIVPLACVRKTKHRFGITWNAVYFWRLFCHLRSHGRDGDVIVTASFPKLFHFLLGKKRWLPRFQTAYEVHQLTLLDAGGISKRSQFELRVLARIDQLITTTEPLRAILQKHCPGLPVCNLGLACGFSPSDFPLLRQRQPKDEFVLAYIGSVYREQGVEWLIRAWSAIRAAQQAPVRLEIVGGTPVEADRLRQVVLETHAPSVTVHGAISPTKLSAFLTDVDALVIPALSEGRVPYVAITKAYDYLGMRRPVLASHLPTIIEVMRPQQEAVCFQPGDQKDFAAKLSHIIADPDRAAGYADQAARRCLEYGWQRRAEKYWGFIRGNSTQ